MHHVSWSGKLRPRSCSGASDVAHRANRNGVVGKSLREICEQIKDPKRNGGKSMEQLVEFMAEDTLVGWGWAPGVGREPAPGTQKEFGALIRAWVESGAACPA